LKIKPEAKTKGNKSIWILLHLEDQDKNKINPSAMYIHLEGSNPKLKIITQSILLHLEIAVEFCQ
jgi:hypothetical protein